MARGHNIVVIGASSGGLEALNAIVDRLPINLPAAIFIVQHMAPDASGEALLRSLNQHRKFDCRLARNDETFKMGTIYVAPPDYHLLVKKTTMLVTKGARENRSRPGIDPLFRSAAVAHGPHVIGVILSGQLDDGTAGMIAIQKCGGITIVQDPADAAYPDMPQSAIAHLKVDYCVTAAEIGALLEQGVRQSAGERKPIPHDVKTEAIIAERVLSDVAQVNGLGSQVPYNCPNCGGVLWEMDDPIVQRYRCHTGHSFTASTLLTNQTEKIEETLWICLRMLEERKNLLNSMHLKEKRPAAKNSYAERVTETATHIERVRDMLLARNES